jgi:hypothetical protein
MRTRLQKSFVPESGLNVLGEIVIIGNDMPRFWKMLMKKKKIKVKSKGSIFPIDNSLQDVE